MSFFAPASRFMLLGRRSSFDEASARVLLVGGQGAAFGFVVPRLCHIESTVWEQPAGVVGPGGALGQHPLIEVGPANQRRTLPLLDLQALAQVALSGAQAGAPPRCAESGAEQACGPFEPAVSTAMEASSSFASEDAPADPPRSAIPRRLSPRQRALAVET